MLATLIFCFWELSGNVFALKTLFKCRSKDMWRTGTESEVKSSWESQDISKNLIEVLIPPRLSKTEWNTLAKPLLFLFPCLMLNLHYVLWSSLCAREINFMYRFINLLTMDSIFPEGMWFTRKISLPERFSCMLIWCWCCAKFNGKVTRPSFGKFPIQVFLQFVETFTDAYAKYSCTSPGYRKEGNILVDW